MHLEEPWNDLIIRFNELLQKIAEINPTQRAVLWIQLTAGALTVVWIVFQFAWLRRLNEARLERYLEDRISDERDDLVRERTEVLLKIERFTKARGAIRMLLLVWAHVRLTFSLLLRLLSLGTARGLTDHTSLLMQVGLLHRARAIHTEVAQDAVRKMRLYQEAATNKRMEAQNAFLFAGRVATLEGRPVAAVAAFKTARCLQEDPHARLLIGRSLKEANDLDGALAEYEAGLGHASITEDPSVAAELHRAIAGILLERRSFGRALRQLNRARELEEPLREYRGLGKTSEMLGDLWAPRPRYRNAAKTAYRKAIECFERAGDQRDVRRIKRKLSVLRGEQKSDGKIVRALVWAAELMSRLAERLRARANRKGG